jgi:hypothetical protein
LHGVSFGAVACLKRRIIQARTKRGRNDTARQNALPLAPA